MTRDQAAEIILKRTEDEVRHDMAKMVRAIEEEARHEGERRAKDILSICIQRTAASHVADTTVSVVPLPSDDMKGRIIGREGRNIRTLENLTGIDFIIDDTPEAVVLSGFDTVRREIARLTLSKLVADGRIHPAKIEEMYSKAREEVEKEIQDAGEQAVLDANVHGVAPELLRLLGRLKFRTSYGQNVLMHSLEVAHLAGLMANELGVNAKLAKRAGLLHDLGKAVDHEVEGSHAAIGANLARRYGESEAVAHVIEAHHNEVEPTTVEAVLVAAGDAVSGARPGARRETLETYIKRLEIPGAHRREQARGGEVLRHPGRPGDQGAGQARRDRRRGRRSALPRDRQGDRAGTRLPGHDPRDGHPREPRRGVRQVASAARLVRRGGGWRESRAAADLLLCARSGAR